MKNILFLLFLIPICGFSQKENITISGKIEMISYYQGGVELPREMYMPGPYATKIYVVAYTDSLTVPTVVDSIQSDINGKYEISLPPGKYGFVTKGDLANLQPGQYLPTPFYSMDERATSNNVSWTASQEMPYKLSSASDFVLNFVYSNTTICGMCQ